MTLAPNWIRTGAKVKHSTFLFRDPHTVSTLTVTHVGTETFTTDRGVVWNLRGVAPDGQTVISRGIDDGDLTHIVSPIDADVTPPGVDAMALLLDSLDTEELKRGVRITPLRHHCSPGQEGSGNEVSNDLNDKPSEEELADGFNQDLLEAEKGSTAAITPHDGVWVTVPFSTDSLRSHPNELEALRYANKDPERETQALFLRWGETLFEARQRFNRTNSGGSGD